jgi:diaminopimelate decarboxylase
MLIVDAVKCNPDPLIIKTLATMGCNFDCASPNEIRLVIDATKDSNDKPDIIYANPCKSRLGILEAVCTFPLSFLKLLLIPKLKPLLHLMKCIKP